MRDFKNNFYRSLQLPKEESEILKWYRKNVRKILNDSENKQIKDKEDKSND
jgi:hypothetical protein